MAETNDKTDFHDELLPWFRLSLNIVNVGVFTIMGVDFVQALQTGKMASLLFIPFNPPINFAGPTSYWFMFAETMVIGYMWTKSISRFPKRFKNAIRRKQK